MIAIPPSFAAGIVAEHGERGRLWLAGLPDLVASLCEDWTLTVDGAPRHGHLGIAVPVRRAAIPCVLKVSWPSATALDEARALSAWRGAGMVGVYASDRERSALLMEQLDADRSLAQVPIDEAMPVMGDLVRRLSIPAAAGFPAVAELAGAIEMGMIDRWDRLGRPVPRRFIDQCIDLIGATPAEATHMVNWDLHAGNVLWSPERRDWVAIDPKAAVGPPEFGIAQLLWTRLDEMGGPSDLRRHIATLTRTANLDPASTRAWIVVRVVDYWLWAVSIGLTDDPRRCATLLAWLDPSPDRA